MYKGKCENCGSRLFVQVLGTWDKGEHPTDGETPENYDKDENSYATNVGQKCIECGTVVLRKDIPQSHEDEFGTPDGCVDCREK